MVVNASLPLKSLSEAQRTQALERFVLLRPALEGQMTQTQLACEQHISLSTIQRWIKQYREQGLAGLTNARRTDKGKSRRLPAEAITVLCQEGLPDCHESFAKPSFTLIGMWQRFVLSDSIVVSVGSAEVTGLVDLHWLILQV